MILRLWFIFHGGILACCIFNASEAPCSGVTGSVRKWPGWTPRSGLPKGHLGARSDTSQVRVLLPLPRRCEEKLSWGPARTLSLLRRDNAWEKEEEKQARKNKGEREGKDQSGGFPLKDLSWQAMLKMGKNDAFRFSSQKKWGWNVSWSVSTSNLGRSVKPKRGPARVSRFFPHLHHRAW